MYKFIESSFFVELYLQGALLSNHRDTRSTRRATSTAQPVSTRPKSRSFIVAQETLSSETGRTETALPNGDPSDNSSRRQDGSGHESGHINRNH